MKPSAEESELTARLPATLVVDCQRHDYVDGAGLSLWDCRVLNQGWRGRANVKFAAGERGR